MNWLDGEEFLKNQFCMYLHLYQTYSVRESLRYKWLIKQFHLSRQLINDVTLTLSAVRVQIFGL